MSVSLTGNTNALITRIPADEEPLHGNAAVHTVIIVIVIVVVVVVVIIVIVIVIVIVIILV